MNIYVYSDESGVFDKAHNQYFVFGGVILFGTESKDLWSRKYSHAEKVLRANKGVAKNYELKASQITNKEKNKLFRSLNNCYKFGVIINQNKVMDKIFQNKKAKQRYLDYAYKIAVRKALESYINADLLNPDEVEQIFFYVDEHNTATNGIYELKEALEQEFKLGTYNYNYKKFYPPIFPKMEVVSLEFCNSQSKLLIRAADIVANKIYYLARNEKYGDIPTTEKLHVIYLPN